MAEKQKPIEKVQSGFVHGAIWKNHGSEGDFYTVTLERTYKEDEKLKSTQSFGANDLPHVGACATKAALAIDRLMAAQRKSR